MRYSCGKKRDKYDIGRIRIFQIPYMCETYLALKSSRQTPPILTSSQEPENAIHLRDVKPHSDVLSRGLHCWAEPIPSNL
jgi:hypothetical protein